MATSSSSAKKSIATEFKGTWLAFLPVPHLATMYRLLTDFIDKKDYCDDAAVVGSTGPDGIEVLKPVEETPHVTILAGLPPVSEDLKQKLAMCGDIHMKVTGVSLFQVVDKVFDEAKPEEKHSYDVLYLAVGPLGDHKTLSPDTIRSIITDYTGIKSTYHKDVMHVTLCYLKPGKASKYMELAGSIFAGFDRKVTFLVNHLHWAPYGDRSVKPTVVPLVK